MMNPTELQALAQRITAAVKAHDQCRTDINATHAERHALLARDCSQEQLQPLSAKLERLEQAKKDAENELSEILPQVRSACEDMVAASPSTEGAALLELLSDRFESALVRCERAVEFIAPGVVNPS